MSIIKNTKNSSKKKHGKVSKIFLKIKKKKGKKKDFRKRPKFYRVRKSKRALVSSWM